MLRICILLMLVGTAVMSYGPSASHAQTPTPAVVSPEVSHDDANGQERVSIRVSDVSNLGAFEFVLVFDGNLVKVDGVEKGDFLASSGREVLCLDPTIDEAAVRYSCVTLGGTPEHGSDGSGVLATVTLSPKGKGKTSVELSHVRLSDPTASQIESTVSSATLDVFDEGNDRTWVFWLVVIGTAVVIVAALIAAGGYLLARRSRTAAAS